MPRIIFGIWHIDDYHQLVLSATSLSIHKFFFYLFLKEVKKNPRKIFVLLWTRPKTVWLKWTKHFNLTIKLQANWILTRAHMCVEEVRACMRVLSGVFAYMCAGNALTYVLMLSFNVYWHRCTLQHSPPLWWCQIRKFGEIDLMKGKWGTHEMWRRTFYLNHMESTNGLSLHGWTLYLTYSYSETLTITVWLQKLLATFISQLSVPQAWLVCCYAEHYTTFPMSGTVCFHCKRGPYNRAVPCHFRCPSIVGA